MIVVPGLKAVVTVLLAAFAMTSPVIKPESFKVPAPWEETVQELSKEGPHKLTPPLGQPVTDESALGMIKRYGDFPVVVKGRGERGIFQISEVIKPDFEKTHPEIIYIREVWVPTESNLKGLHNTQDPYLQQVYRYYAK